MTSLQFLEMIRDYIESCEEEFEAERGSTRSVCQMIEDGGMPDEYEEVVRRIAALGEGE